MRRVEKEPIAEAEAEEEEGGQIREGGEGGGGEGGGGGRGRGGGIMTEERGAVFSLRQRQPSLQIKHAMHC